MYSAYNYPTSGNLGDDIQTLAAIQFLPQVDFWINRDKAKQETQNLPSSTLIANGWYHWDKNQWPASPQTKPIYISIHISQIARKWMLSKENIEHFKLHEPIGCRDLATQTILNKHNIKTYYSNCLTLTLINDKLIRKEDVYIVDCNAYYPEAKRLTHCTIEQNREKRQEEAKQLLNLYKTAKLVITGRLHCVLPCLAFGTPVIFMPPNPKDDRFECISHFPIQKDLNNLNPNIPDISDQVNFLKAKMNELLA